MLRMLFLGSLLISSLYAQPANFDFLPLDTTYSGSDELVLLHGEIISRSAEAQNITMNRVTHAIPAGWVSSFCVGPACLPPFLDTYTFELAAEDTAEFSLDTYPNGIEGVGSWTMFAVDSSTLEVDSVNFIMEFVAVGILDEPEHPAAFDLSSTFPNPTNASVSFDLHIRTAGNYRVTLYDLAGHPILSRNYDLSTGVNRMSWELQGLASGNYLLRAGNEATMMTRKVSVIK